MDGSGAGGGKVFGRFTGPAHQVLDLARAEAEHLLLGELEDARQPADTPNSSRRHRQVIAHVGLPDGYHGAAGPLFAGHAVDLGRLQEAVAADLRGSQR
jgi:hypothetical protein